MIYEKIKRAKKILLFLKTHFNEFIDKFKKINQVFYLIKNENYFKFLNIFFNFFFFFVNFR